MPRGAGRRHTLNLQTYKTIQVRISKGKILALAFMHKSLKPFDFFHVCSEAWGDSCLEGHIGGAAVLLTHVPS